jgi:hypothetical protein
LRIFLDTTELHKQDELKQLHWERLKTLADAQLVEMAVSEVTVSELVRQWTERYTAKLAKLRTAWMEFAKLHAVGSIGAFDATAFDVPTQAAAFCQRLLSRLAELRIEVISLPRVTHHDVLARDFATRKPFDREGKGYRDTLIWLSFLDWLASGPGIQTIFVSNNARDFGQNGFDASLAQDLDPFGTVAVSLRTTLSDEVETLWEELNGEALLAAASESDEEWGHDDAETASLVAVENAAIFLIESNLTAPGSALDGIAVYGLEMPHWPEPLTINSIEFERDSLDLQLMEDFGSGTQYFSASIEANVDAVGLLPKGHAYISGLAVIDRDFNQHYAEVELTFDCQIDFEVRYEEGDGGSAEAELTKITWQPPALD